MGRVWLEAATLAHTKVRCRKVKKRAAPRKKTDQAGVFIELLLSKPKKLDKVDFLNFKNEADFTLCFVIVLAYNIVWIVVVEE